MRGFLADWRGNVAVIFGFSLPVILSLVGVAVDGTNLYRQHTIVQNLADTAALAVAKELHLYRKKPGELKAIGIARIDTLLDEAGLGNRPHSAEIDIDLKENLIDVDISLVAKSLLPVQVVGENPIRAHSQAMAYGQSRLCVLALEGSKSDAIKADNGTVLTAPDCAVQSNSKNADGLNVSSDSRIVSTLICTSGGYKGSDSSFEPAPEVDCLPLEDPLSERRPPAAIGCDYLDTEIKDTDTSISPGVYCGGLKIDGTATVTAEPGDYVISLGKLEVKGEASLLGENVSFYFPDDLSTLSFDEKTTIDLTAPKEGGMAGILFFQSALLPLGQKFTIKSTNARRLLGTIYLPKGTLAVDSKSNVAGESAYTVIVANKLDVKHANLIINADYGGSDVPVPDGVGPNSKMVKLTE